MPTTSPFSSLGYPATQSESLIIVRSRYPATGDGLTSAHSTSQTMATPPQTQVIDSFSESPHSVLAVTESDSLTRTRRSHPCAPDRCTPRSIFAYLDLRDVEQTRAVPGHDSSARQPIPPTDLGFHQRAPADPVDQRRLLAGPGPVLRRTCCVDSRLIDDWRDPEARDERSDVRVHMILPGPWFGFHARHGNRLRVGPRRTPFFIDSLRNYRHLRCFRCFRRFRRRGGRYARSSPSALCFLPENLGLGAQAQR